MREGQILRVHLAVHLLVEVAELDGPGGPLRLFAELELARRLEELDVVQRGFALRLDRKNQGVGLGGHVSQRTVERHEALHLILEFRVFRTRAGRH